MSMVGRAVESHRRALEEEQRLRDIASRQVRTGKGKKAGKSLGGPGLIGSRASGPVYQADLTGLGISC